MASIIKSQTTATKAATKPYNPAYVTFQPVNQTGGATSEASSSPLLWIAVAFIAYQLMKK